MNVELFLAEMERVLSDRNTTRNLPPNTSVMKQVVDTFNTATHSTMSLKEGYIFMFSLKMVRMGYGYATDDAIDLAGYAALMEQDLTKETQCS